MKRFFSYLLNVAGPDESITRQARNIVVVALALIALWCIALPLSLADPTAFSTTLGIIGTGICFVLAIILVHQGRIQLAGWLVVASMILISSISLLSRDGSATVAFYLILPIIITGLFFRPSYIWLVFGANFLVLGVSAFWNFPQSMMEEATRQVYINSALLMIVVALLTYLSAFSMNHAIQTASEAHAQTERALKKVSQINETLESRVQQRTVELESAVSYQKEQAEKLQKSVELQQRLNQVIEDLSLPILPVRDDVLVAPLIGNIDSGRAELLLSRVLHEIESRRVRSLVLDVTGVAVVDTHVAQAIIQTATATRLLGAETLLVGIRPEMAQTLVSLGADLSSLRTAVSLQHGLDLLS